MKSRLMSVSFCICCLHGGAHDAVADTNSQPGNQALATITTLDAPRYMGTWHEIAKYPNRFQRKCVGYTRAEYSPVDDGTLKVINRCMLESGEMDEVIGRARQVGGSTSPKLKVRFAPAWLSFIPAVWGDYWVIDLDENYQLAAVSEPTREYLWILARTPKVDHKSYQQLLARLADKGFNIQKLEVTRQAD